MIYWNGKEYDCLCSITTEKAVLKNMGGFEEHFPIDYKDSKVIKESKFHTLCIHEQNGDSIFLNIPVEEEDQLKKIADLDS